MSFLSRLFGSGSTGRSSKDVDAQLQRFEREAEEAAPGYVGSAYNRAGDLALREDRPEKAVNYYGRAIDAFLEDAQREAARGVANKILRVRPSALRTLCTLTWLDLASKHEATALLHLRDYVEKAAERGEQGRAAAQIYQMARICPLEEFVGAVADSLDGLDFPNRAREVRRWVADGPPDIVADSDDLADACLQAAILSNEAGEELVDDCGDDEGDIPDTEEAEEADAAVDAEEPVTAVDAEEAVAAVGAEDAATAVDAEEAVTAEDAEEPVAAEDAVVTDEAYGDTPDAVAAEGDEAVATEDAPDASDSSEPKQSRKKRKKRKKKGRRRG